MKTTKIQYPRHPLSQEGVTYFIDHLLLLTLLSQEEPPLYPDIKDWLRRKAGEYQATKEETIRAFKILKGSSSFDLQVHWEVIKSLRVPYNLHQREMWVDFVNKNRINALAIRRDFDHRATRPVLYHHPYSTLKDKKDESL